MKTRAKKKSRNKPQAHEARLVPYDAARYLKSDRAIAAYLNEALRSQDPRFLLAALGDVARARGMTGVARLAGLGRENLYKSLASAGNPRVKTLFRVAAVLGVRFEVRVA
jgi:probable addiction module antidote protein